MKQNKEPVTTEYNVLPTIHYASTTHQGDLVHQHQELAVSGQSLAEAKQTFEKLKKELIR